MSLAIRDVDGRRHLPRLLMNADWRRHAGELVLVQEAGSGRRRQRSNGRRANHISGIHSALGRVDLLVERAQACGVNDDPLVRQEITNVLSLSSAAKWTAQRAAAARARGRPPGPEGSLGKLMTSNIACLASRTHSLITGAPGMLAGSDVPLEGTITEIFVSVPGQSIAGGTDEIQHNIIAERILGLPKDLPADRDLPFRDVARNQ